VFNYSTIGSLQLAALIANGLAASFVRLFVQGFVPNPTNSIADFEANEATFSGYPSGGIECNSWNGPLFDPSGGSSIESGVKQFAFVPASPPVTNVIGGCFLVDSFGNLIGYAVFAAPVTVAMFGQGVPVNISLPFGANT